MKRDDEADGGYTIADIEHGLRNLGAEHEPPSVWQERVLADIERRPLTVGRLLVTVLVVIAGAALLAAFVIWIVVGG